MSGRAFSFTAKDAFITVLLVLAGIIIILKAGMASKLVMPPENLTVTMVIEAQLPNFHKSIRAGDKIYQKGALSPFGTVVSVEAKPAKIYTADAKGHYYLREFPEQEDVYVTVRSPGFLSLSGAPIIDDTFFYANQYMPAHTERATFASRILDVEKQGGSR
ncbi:uncharacterized protein DUF4330 [Aneurinibacillus soli]|uniref:Uncharacterized protein n=1 Tax=Aneurinibacillus soli TaxID=1500254 RepID=A0A0U4WDN6_9BACL|nr:DUF4330 family protein [Aneurinibacillus soli]PYE62360.1 uncharacterized protein DUF4330 [Aneurinibacillus soli]BAU26923.1 hypothetical protein CB4_01092 [Aneurinibacillus soli]